MKALSLATLRDGAAAQQVAGPQCGLELEAGTRLGQHRAGQLLDLAQPVADRLRVHMQLARPP